MTPPPRILYCNCTYAQVVPKEVKEAVLKKLSEAGAVKIAACYPRAVKWLFHAAQADLPVEATEVLNMRVQNADDVCAALFKPEIKPNLPTGKSTEPTAAELPKSE